jgi:hypothetical protein
MSCAFRNGRGTHPEFLERVLLGFVFCLKLSRHTSKKDASRFRDKCAVRRNVRNSLSAMSLRIPVSMYAKLVIPVRSETALRNTPEISQER